ncbi:MAG: hypothetical protein JOZ57_10710 [Abitibacteriaceae bacterium]|nr:hypothetical protein [Abditibacteriaceae bacterium]
MKLAVTWLALAALPGTLGAQPAPQSQPLAREERVVSAPDALLTGLLPEAANQWAQALKQARVGAKYRTLLCQIALPDDARLYGVFRDYGYFDGPTWKGMANLPEGMANPPAGYWVYVQPCWYIWRHLAAPTAPAQQWGAEQATGAPNTDQLGDATTAWASNTPDGHAEWLLLEYDTPRVPTSIKIYESFNPGAVSRITAFLLDGREEELWHGTDPLRDLQGNMGIFTLQLKANFQTNRIKLYLDSPAALGWNEIDAVGLMDTDKEVHWATTASASSVLGVVTGPEPPGGITPPGAILPPAIVPLLDQ